MGARLSQFEFQAFKCLSWVCFFLVWKYFDFDPADLLLLDFHQLHSWILSGQWLLERTAWKLLYLLSTLPKSNQGGSCNCQESTESEHRYSWVCNKNECFAIWVNLRPEPWTSGCTSSQELGNCPQNPTSPQALLRCVCLALPRQGLLTSLSGGQSSARGYCGWNCRAYTTPGPSQTLTRPPRRGSLARRPIVWPATCPDLGPTAGSSRTSPSRTLRQPEMLQNTK